VVDLGQGRYLFALISGAEQRGRLLCSVTLAAKAAQQEQDVAVYDQLEASARRAAARLHRPLLVTFADINDPASVQRVDPDDLAASFGPGYALTTITLAITDEPVTKGRVEAVLPCLKGDEVCIPLNKALPYGNPMRFLPNGVIRSR
jgi:hypothetical protein